MGDRRISRKLNREVLTSCVTPAYMYGLVNMILTEKQQENEHVCENNWIRIIVGVKRKITRRMEELIIKVGGKGNFKMKLVIVWKEWEMIN